MQPTTEPTTAAEPDAPEPRRWAFRAIYPHRDRGRLLSIRFEIQGLLAATAEQALMIATNFFDLARSEDGWFTVRQIERGEAVPTRIQPSQIFLLQIAGDQRDLEQFDRENAAIEERLAESRLADPAEAELAALGTATAALGDRFAHSAGA